MKIRDFKALRFDISKRPYDFSASLGEKGLNENVNSFLNHLNVESSRVYFMNQTHSDHCVVLDDDHAEEDYFGFSIVPDTDALITSKKGIALVSRISDCTPVLLYDPIKGVQACIHSGWRPTVKKLPQIALDKMRERYGSLPKDIYAYIGPCIGRESFQVGKEVSEAWRAAFPFHREVIRYSDAEHDYIDMKLTHIRMLQQMGVPDDHITVNIADTFTDPRYHSYRRDKPDFGSNALVSILK